MQQNEPAVGGADQTTATAAGARLLAEAAAAAQGVGTYRG